LASWRRADSLPAGSESEEQPDQSTPNSQKRWTDERGPVITDVPADGAGRSYLVEPEIASMAELEALVADYLAKARRLGYVPCPCTDGSEKQP